MESGRDLKKETPALTWEERYRRMVDAAYAIVMSAEELVHAKCTKDTALEIRKGIHRALALSVAKKLIDKYSLKPTLEDALKLCVLYSAEVWGYGAREYVDTRMEAPNRGIYANLICRGWELAKRDGKLDLMKEMDCAQGCIVEYETLVHALNPNIKIKMTKARPWGDDRCEWVLEL